jgi:hypothetical protein
MQPMLHDVKLKVTEKETEIHIENVAPENIMVSVEVKVLTYKTLPSFNTEK